jgi:hypothetical protein
MSKWFVPPDRDIEAEAKAQGWTPPPRPEPLPADSTLEVLTAPGPAKHLEIICRSEDSQTALALIAVSVIRSKRPVEIGAALAALKAHQLPAEIAGYTLVVDETLPRRRARYRLTGETLWRDLTIQDQE